MRERGARPRTDHKSRAALAVARRTSELYSSSRIIPFIEFCPSTSYSFKLKTEPLIFFRSPFSCRPLSFFPPLPQRCTVHPSKYSTMVTTVQPYIDQQESSEIMSDNGDDSLSTLPMEKVRQMIDACATGDAKTIQELVQQNTMFVSQQDLETGLSPLMAAAKAGNTGLCQQLLEGGAPWNAIDRKGQCAGNFATDAEHWEVVNLLVEWGTRSELILGELERTTQRNQAVGGATSILTNPSARATSAEEESSTKPDYLDHKLKYNEDGTALLDQDDDAVMMEWERPLMQAHAQILMEAGSRVLNVGFGMGIIDGILQDQYKPTLHIIIEAHPDVYKKMLADKWDQKPNVKICHGKWQEVMPQLIQQGVEVDGVFFDTYGEHSMDMEDFHVQMSQILSKPNGIYSFFNGLAPDNLFFHGVACQVVKLQLDKLGFDAEFLQCQIQVNNDKVWEGIRRKYWHNRDVYYLPRVTWNQEFLGRKTKAEAEHTDMDVEAAGQSKRQRRMEG